MPNHVINRINLKGDKNKITEMLEAIKTDEFTLSFELENFFVAPGKNMEYKVKIKK